jgi:hypothetical protein
VESRRQPRSAVVRTDAPPVRHLIAEQCVDAVVPLHEPLKNATDRDDPLELLGRVSGFRKLGHAEVLKHLRDIGFDKFEFRQKHVADRDVVELAKFVTAGRFVHDMENARQ